MNKEIILQINYYCHRLGYISNLVFARNDCSDLESVLADLKELDKICIKEVE